MRYLSTRGAWRDDRQSFSAILLEGLAPDGGLAVPESWPRFSDDELAAMASMGYRDLAFAVLSRFVDDIPADGLRAIVDRTYTKQGFGSDEIAPLLDLESGLSLLRVSNGPTLSFKDIALQLLGRLFEHVLAREGRDLNILGATSGDTGSSAEVAMLGRRGVRVFMLSPRGRMSPFQTAQMYTIDDPAIHNIAIEGVFDDCQDVVKAIAGDAAFKAAYRIGAVNSINWARVAAQVVYYFKGAFAASRAGGEVDFAVPSGNFGNVFAGHVAKRMGAPIRRLIVATNENDVLDEFFRTGRYRVRMSAETFATSSPSMDIAKASNFERYIWDIVDRDPALVRTLWGNVEREGGFDLARSEYWPRVAASGFVSGRSSHADRIAAIRHCHARYGVMIDPHTADGVHVGSAFRDDDVPLVCIETALPAKFAATIQEALGVAPPRPAGFEDLETRPQHYTVLPPRPDSVAAYIAEHAGEREQVARGVAA